MDENLQQPSEDPSRGGMKIVQPSASFVQEMQSTQASSASTQLNGTSSVPVDASSRRQTVPAPSSIYPEPTKGIGIDQKQPPTQDTPSKITNDTPVSVLSRVPALKSLILLGVGLSSLQLLVLLVFRSELLGSIAILHFTVHGALTTLLEVMAYASQFSVMVNLLFFLWLTLSKSFRVVHKLLSVAIVVNVISGAVNLVSFNITGIIFTFVVVAYIQSVRSQVDITSIERRAA